jgi:nitrogenase-stabilizing/protective protein
MDDLLKAIEKLVNAEDYLKFFGISYDPKVVHVNRLHILKKFALYKNQIDLDQQQISPEKKLAEYKNAMEKAYETFLRSTAPEERLFKVFQQPPPGLIQIQMNRK